MNNVHASSLSVAVLYLLLLSLQIDQLRAARKFREYLMSNADSLLS
jgi:hypothetical protein